MMKRAVGFAALALALFATAASGAELRFRSVEGSGEVPLNVVEAGDSTKPGILLIHGIGQSYLAFERQLRSSLADRYHLVAFDLRGHGNSGKPWTAASYADTAVWADDVQRVMAATGLHRPVILGWSYGSIVTADYVRRVGTTNLAGIVLVAALGGLTPPAAASAPSAGDALAENRARQASASLEENFAAAHVTLGQLTARPMPADWSERTLMMMAMVPNHVRPLLWRHPAANTDLVAKIDVPLLIIGGGQDPSVQPAAATALAAQVTTGTYLDYETAGHSPFAEEPERFNRDLDAFALRRAGVRL